MRLVDQRGQRILIVEDEPSLADALRYGLEREGFMCSTAADGPSALARFETDRPDLILLDLMLPGISGVDVCRSIRQRAQTPIVMVTARDSETDKVLGLELGADDYITKPFSIRELIARVRTVLRRASGVGTHAGIEPEVVAAGPVRLDLDRHEAIIDGRALDLPPKEFLLLQYLIERAGKLCRREVLIAEIWGPDYYGDTRTLDVHIKRLREKLEPDRNTPRHITTVRGLGYKFEP